MLSVYVCHVLKVITLSGFHCKHHDFPFTSQISRKNCSRPVLISIYEMTKIFLFSSQILRSVKKVIILVLKTEKKKIKMFILL
jgi:hypothetical protein